MSHLVIPRPQPSEYGSFYDRYVDLVPEGDVLRQLESGAEDTLALLRAFGEERGGYRYAPGKWSVKEVVGHVTDAERVFAYRALRFARGDATTLPGFEQDGYVATAQFDRRSLADLAEEFADVRKATVKLFTGFDAAALRRSGVASETPMSVRALVYVIAGHELHHADVLRERYLVP